jgi:hypothetical protein
MGYKISLSLGLNSPPIATAEITPAVRTEKPVSVFLKTFNTPVLLSTFEIEELSAIKNQRKPMYPINRTAFRGSGLQPL